MLKNALLCYAVINGKLYYAHIMPMNNIKLELHDFVSAVCFDDFSNANYVEMAFLQPITT